MKIEIANIFLGGLLFFVTTVDPTLNRKYLSGGLLKIYLLLTIFRYPTFNELNRCISSRPLKLTDSFFLEQN